MTTEIQLVCFQYLEKASDYIFFGPSFEIFSENYNSGDFFHINIFFICDGAQSEQSL